MRFFSLLLLAVVLSFASLAQAREMENYDTVKVRALDKITARTETLDLKIGETVQFGSVFIKVQACRKALPIEQPESAAFVQVWEFPPGRSARSQEEPQWVYSGWMFASSPGLSAMDHAIYDIWVLDCTGNVVEAPSVLEGDDQNSTPESE